MTRPKSGRRAASSRAPRRGRRQTHARRVDRRLLLLAAGAALAVVGVIALALVSPGGRDRGSTPWATLGTADVHALAFDPDDPSRLYFGHHGGLLESRDAGRSWRPTSLSGVDAMNVRPSAAGRIQIAGHALYVESTDGGASWQPVPSDLPGLDLHAFVTDPADADRAWAYSVGFGLFETRDGGRHWELRQPGDWGHLAAYRDGARTMLVAVGQDGLVDSPDGGATWTPLASPGAPLAGGIAATDDGSVLYGATTGGLRRSTDQGQSWEMTAFDDTVLAVAVAPGDPMKVAVVDRATRFYRSLDGGATWPSP